MRYGWVKVALVAAALTVAACDRGGAGGSGEAANAEALAAATAFMAQNAKAEGIQSLPTGVQYKVVQSGPAGGASPDRNDLVSVHYEGTLTDGTVFDSSFQRGVPAVFRLDEVVPGWGDVISHMKPGDEWIAYIPPDRGYGDVAKGDIPANSALVFRIKLLDVAPEPGDAPAPGTAMG